ncbi:general transcription factor IIH subunit 4 isoform X2 [Penaeus vannamei]|uniref:general transcription factor IIH subunit 4 isoform X2 n=1 Tax=Penaeus vannamei TaxID=6689 RepID=UPI00387F5EF2
MSRGTATLTYKNLLDYLKALPKDALTALYRSPAACLAVFRELPELSRQFILRLLFVTKPISQAILALWIPHLKPNEDLGNIAAEHKQSAQILFDMYIWRELKDQQGNPFIKLSWTFRENLKIATLGGGKPWTMSAALDPDPHRRDLQFLDKYAMNRWENVLIFLIQPGKRATVISRKAIRTLVHAGLIKSDESDSSIMQITNSGFQFLLLDTASQVWFFILKYLETVTEHGLNLVACLTFLFKLSFSTVGVDYSMAGMNNELLTFLQHLRKFGLVYVRRRRSGRFYPTKLARTITAGQNKGNLSVPKQGNLIIDTNHRIYAYTTSELRIALYSIFSIIKSRFPNMVFAYMSRRSVRRALLKGISAEQLVSFLTQHCHPQMYKQNPVVPRTISDQIKMWEMERKKIKFSEGVLYKDFKSIQDFVLLMSYASTRDVLIYSDGNRQIMVVVEEGHPTINQFREKNLPE